MSLSVLDLFSIGIGPSSSHTVGPMKASLMFLNALKDNGFWQQTSRLQIELFGSLGLTGKAHGSEKAILLGLEGETAEGIDPEVIVPRLAHIRQTQTLNLDKSKIIAFNEVSDLIFHRQKTLPEHSNGMRFTAFYNDVPLLEKIYYSTGGGFVAEENFTKNQTATETLTVALPYPFSSGDELLAQAEKQGLSIADLVRANEVFLKSAEAVSQKIKKVWEAMQACVVRGLKSDGVLPGGLKVKRRAPEVHRRLLLAEQNSSQDPLLMMDWVNLYALAVNEENAMGGKVVTAPTNGAAGIIPAVLHYFVKTHPEASPKQIEDFLLTAGAIGWLYKRNASISGAEVGCQGEVGVACSMAAAGLTQVLNGTNLQIENAAEIGMEHNLGLTCDPVGGLVQIPCIERNAMGAIKAINATRMALLGDGTHKISLDKVIKTMFDTGKDMHAHYKETSTGGLAVNIGVVEC